MHTALNGCSNHGACSSLLAPNCRKGLVIHQRKACSGKAFRPQDHALAVTTCLSARAICHLHPLSPRFIWQSVCFSLNGRGATCIDLLAPGSWSPLYGPSPHPCSHKSSRKKPYQPNQNTWERKTRRQQLVKHPSSLALENQDLLFPAALSQHRSTGWHTVGLCALAFSVFFSFLWVIIKCVHFSNICLFGLEIAQK